MDSTEGSPAPAHRDEDLRRVGGGIGRVEEPGGDLTARIRKGDFVFHLSDCVGDLAALSAWLRDPDLEDEDVAVSGLIGMLYHIIPHLDAAGRLLLDKVNDPFVNSGRSASLGA